MNKIQQSNNQVLLLIADGKLFYLIDTSKNIKGDIAIRAENNPARGVQEVMYLLKSETSMRPVLNQIEKAFSIRPEEFN